MEHAAEVRAVRAALEHEPDVNLHRDQIAISADGVIRLEGEVENIMVKRRALQIARRAADGLPVEDRLRLRVRFDRDGDELLQAVLRTLTEEPVFQGFAIGAGGGQPPPRDQKDWLRAEVDGNLVRLHGVAWSLSHRRMAEVLAWWVPGTADVDNRIRVQPAEQDTDDELTDAIRLVFDKDPSLDAQKIHVSTHDGEVTLEGDVTSEENRRIAAFDCWYIPGVHTVRNTLEIRPHGP